MRIPGVKTAKFISRWARSRILGGALILGYHRVANVTQDEYDNCVTPEHFDEHMDVLSKYLNPISLSKLVGQLKDGSLPPKAVAVTFDDGYADSLYKAKPILENYAVPATVFVTTGYAGKEFWWDELERLVMSSQADLRAIRLQVGENQFLWDQAHIDSAKESSEERRQCCHALYRFLLPLNAKDQTHAMDMIRIWSEVSSHNIPTARAMNHNELLQLADSELIEIGSHTCNHLMLTQLTPEQQREEIVSGKQDLELLLGRQIEGFAYPNGKMLLEAKVIVQDEGFQYACSSQIDLFRPGCDLYDLPRFWPKDINGDRFIQYLKRWISLK